MSRVEHTFSLVVNTIDRAGPLHTLLRALEHQSYPHFEVIVVVGPTRDHTLEVLAQYDGRVRLLRCPTANLSQSRNMGLMAARGDLVAYIDDDAVPSHHWLAQLNRLFADPQLAGSGGKVYRIDPDKAAVQHHLGIASGLAEQVDVRLSWLEPLLPPGEGYQWHGRMMGTNMVFRRGDLLAAGGFDEFYQWVYDDTDIALRLVNEGRLVHPVKEAVVYHVPASSRNRNVNSSIGNWWIQTKAAFYFSLKNGPRGGNSRADIFRRCLHLWHGHLLWYGNLRRQRLITFGQHWRMRLQEARGAASGTFHGLRRAVSTPLPENGDFAARAAPARAAPVLPFQNETSPLQPAVDPISGRQPSISLVEPPLRVCLLSAAYPPHAGDGPARQAHLLAQGLFALGHTVHVITQGERDVVSFYDGAYVHQTPYEAGRYGRYRLFPHLHDVLNYTHAVHEQVQRLRLNDGIQLLDASLGLPDGFVTAVAGGLPLLLRLPAMPVASAGQGNSARLMAEMAQQLIHLADHLVPHSQAALTAVHANYGIQSGPERVTLIQPGIVPVAEAQVRPFDCQNPPPILTVLVTGALAPPDGISQLCDAISQVGQRVPQVHFVILAAGQSRRDEPDVENEVDEAVFFPQQLSETAVTVEVAAAGSQAARQQLVQACDLLLIPWPHGAAALDSLEAMNYGKPVIGCRAGALPEIVDDGITGLLVDPGAPAALAEAMIRLLQAPEQLYEMGRAGRQRLLERFTHVQMAQRLTAVYRTLLQAQAAEAGERS